MKRFSLLLITVLLGSCSLMSSSEDSPDAITFAADQNSYALGSTATAVLSNNSDIEVGYNLCFSNLERKQASEWVPVGPRVTCQAIGKLLPPGEERQYRVTLADSLKLSTSATYRIATGVEIEGEDTTLATAPFSISATGQQD